MTTITSTNNSALVRNSRSLISVHSICDWILRDDKSVKTYNNDELALNKESEVSFINVKNTDSELKNMFYDDGSKASDFFEELKSIFEPVTTLEVKATLDQKGLTDKVLAKYLLDMLSEEEAEKFELEFKETTYKLLKIRSEEIDDMFEQGKELIFNQDIDDRILNYIV